MGRLAGQKGHRRRMALCCTEVWGYLLERERLPSVLPTITLCYSSHQVTFKKMYVFPHTKHSPV